MWKSGTIVPNRFRRPPSRARRNTQSGSVELSMLDFAPRRLNIEAVYLGQGTTEWLTTTPCSLERL